MLRRTRLGRRLAVTTLEPRETPAVVGGLDTTFNSAGSVPGALALTATAGDRINAIALLDDGTGRFVAVGRAASNAGDFLVLRLRPDGTVDPTFNGGTGRRTLDFGGGKDEAFAVGVNNSRIVVAGAGNNPSAFDFCVAQMTLDGAPDNAFDTDGQRNIFHSGTNFARAVGFQSNGTIVLAGSTTGGAGGAADMAAVRVSPATGKTLPGNVTGDVKQFDRSNGDDQAFALVVESSNSVVLGGQTGTTGNTSFAAARLDANLNATTSVTAVAGLAGANRINALARQSDGNIVFAGTDGVNLSADFAVGRLKAADLTRDTSGFNSSGTTPGLILVAVDGQETATSVQLDARGRILVSGFSLDTAATSGNAVGVARLTTDGKLDASFSPAGTPANATPGVARFAFTGTDEPTSVTGAILTPTDRLLVVGNTVDGPAVVAVTTRLPLVTGVGVGGTLDGKASVFSANTTNPVPTQFDTTAYSANSAQARLVRADLTGDGIPELIAVTGPGVDNSLVVLDGDTRAELVRFSPFAAFTGGLFVAAGDLNADGRADIVITPDLTGGPIAVAYSGAKIAAKLSGDAAQVLRFKVILGDDNYRGGVRPAVGDVDGDGKADIMVSAGLGGGPRIALFSGAKVATAAQGLSDAATDGLKLVADFFAFESTQRAGAFVTLGDVTGDGRAELVFGGGPAGGTRIRVYEAGAVLAAAKTITTLDDLPGAAQLSNFIIGDPNVRAGVRVAMADLDGDNRADLVTASGTNQPAKLRVYLGSALQSGNAEPAGGTDVSVLGGGVLADGVYVG